MGNMNISEKGWQLFLLPTFLYIGFDIYFTPLTTRAFTKA